jgi:hypothetical protein
MEAFTVPMLKWWTGMIDRRHETKAGQEPLAGLGNYAYGWFFLE